MDEGKYLDILGLLAKAHLLFQLSFAELMKNKLNKLLEVMPLLQTDKNNVSRLTENLPLMVI